MSEARIYRISVGLLREELELLSDLARPKGLSVAEFIRVTALKGTTLEEES